MHMHTDTVLEAGAIQPALVPYVDRDKRLEELWKS
jgi:hypothetical protein